MGRSTNAAAAKATIGQVCPALVRAKGRRVGWRRRLALVSSALILAGFWAGAAQAASCPWAPNIYAGGTAGGGGHKGVRGYIEATGVSIPQQNENFSDQAYHAVQASGSYGLEVGLYTGWGGQTHTYVTSPHAYATLNGPAEIDGPSVPISSVYFYSTYWSGSTQVYNVRLYKDSTLVFSGTQDAHFSGPGVIVGIGEVDASGLSMNGYYYGVNSGGPFQYYSSTGAWDNWPSVSFCADSPYVVTGDQNVDDYGDYGP